MSDCKRDFKGIWIPKEIWLSEDLTVIEKLMLVEIDSLDNEDGCFASNDHFAQFFSLSKSRCSEIVKILEKKGFIHCKYIYKSNTKSVETRIIKCIRKTEEGIRYSEGGIRKTEEGYSENTEGNNTSISNTSINNKDICRFDDFNKLFEDFWKQYPKHPTVQFSKNSTKKTFLKIVKTEKRFNEVMQALDNWKLSTSWAGGYINNPIKWLKDDLWKEEIEKKGEHNDSNRGSAAKDKWGTLGVEL